MKFSRIRVIDSIPALGSDLLPPGGILLIACHDNMLNRNSLAIEDFLFDFLDSPCDHGYGCKAVAQSHSSAPGCEITMAHVDGNPLKKSIRNEVREGQKHAQAASLELLRLRLPF